MKNSLLVILCLLLICPALRAQRVDSLRFVYTGDEDKPQGTLVISIGKYVKPTDRGVVDTYFGKCIVTDARTFDSLRQFICQSQYPTKESVARLTDSLNQWLLTGYSYYKIILSDGSAVYLNGKYWMSFFAALKSMMRAHSLDPRVIEAL